MALARIPRWLFVVVPVNVLAIALAILAVTVLDRPAATCGDAISLYFDDDARMTAAAKRLRTDDRVEDVQPETHEESSHRLERWHHVDTLYPPDTAAAVHLVATDPSKRTEQIAALKAELSDVRAARTAACTVEDAEAAEAQLVQFGDAVRCSRRLFVWITRDEDLAPAADIARPDPRVHEVRVVMKAEAYERAKAAVKDDPELAKLLTEDVPGSLDVLAETSGDALKLADEFAELPGAEAADVLPCFTVPNPVVPPVR